MPIRKLSETDLCFYLDGMRIPEDAISMGVDDFEIRVDLPKSGMCRLGWICRPFNATADPRRLGLPIMRVVLAYPTTPAKEAPAMGACLASVDGSIKPSVYAS